MRQAAQALGIAIALTGLLAPSAWAYSYASLSSDADDYIGRGQSFYFHDPPDQFQVGNPGVQNEGLILESQDDYDFQFFTASQGTPMAVGNYPNAYADGGDGVHPGIDVGGNGRGCSTSEGSFRVTDLARGLDGVITRFHVFFQQNCEGSTAGLRGEVAYGYPDGTTPADFERKPATPPPPDTTPPTLGAVRFSRNVFRASRTGPSIATRGSTGTRIGFTVSEQSTVAFSVERRRSGRHVRKRWRHVRGRFSAAARPGHNRLLFTGRVGGHRLPPGRYRLDAVATDGAGHRSALVRHGFRVVR